MGYLRQFKRQYLPIIIIFVQLLVFSAPVSAQLYNYETVALPDGTPTHLPGEEFGYVSLGGHSLSEAGHITFLASRILFVDENGTHRTVADFADPAPGTGGGIFWFVNSSGPALSSSGDIAFRADVVLGDVANGLFVDSSGLVSAAVLNGEIAPDTGGGTYRNFVIHAINNSGDIAFRASIAGGTNSVGIFVWSGGSVRAIALNGDPAPGTAGIYSVLRDIAISDSGDVAFTSDLSVGGIGIFVDVGGTVRAVALTGDPAPGTASATYESPRNPTFSATGAIAFDTALSGVPDTGYMGFDKHGIFVDLNGVDTAIVLVGQDVPGSGGGTYSGVGFPAMSLTGEIIFIGGVNSGNVDGGLYHWSNGTVRPVIYAGDLLPETGGGTYLGPASNWSRINSSGVIAFDAYYYDQEGAFTLGIFRALPLNPTVVPAIELPGLIVLGLLLAALGATAFWRLRGSDSAA